ncbi:unnamed protein product [Mytilus coruscus]|uniref:TNFR-Cys domain-containing protein n=1 Tax=Mytilus coruscus TaxID=42192 RepID=A0A6J8DJR4_MYTCO|nr:unnamed protein product [Mytilus coruscus]
MCTECIEGYTYSSSESLNQCLECERKCPNHTHMLHPCNSTHNIECVPNKHSGIPVKENIKTKSSNAITIGVGCGGAVLVVLTIACICIFVKRRTYRSPTNLTPLLNALMRDSLQDDDGINWQKFFNLFQHKIDVLPDWEHFIRTLFTLSEKAENGERAVNEAKVKHEQDQYHSRLYYVLMKWTHCFNNDNDVEMFNILCAAVNKHKMRPVTI